MDVSSKQPQLLHISDAVSPIVTGIAEDAVLRRRAAERAPAAIAAYNALDISVALEAALSISGRANQYLEEQAPWTSLKKGNEEQKAQGRLVLTEVLEAIRIVAVLLNPVTPTLSCAVYRQLGFSDQKSASLELRDAEWGGESYVSTDAAAFSGQIQKKSACLDGPTLFLPARTI